MTFFWIHHNLSVEGQTVFSVVCIFARIQWEYLVQNALVHSYLGLDLVTYHLPTKNLNFGNWIILLQLGNYTNRQRYLNLRRNTYSWILAYVMLRQYITLSYFHFGSCIYLLEEITPLFLLHTNTILKKENHPSFLATNGGSRSLLNWGKHVPL